MLDYSSNEDFDRKGFGLLEDGQFEEAVAVFKEAVEIFPFSAELFSGLGQAYGELGEYVLAARAFQNGLRYSPLDEEMWFGLGLCFLKMNRLSDAGASFEHVEHSLLKDPEALLHLAFAYYQIELPEEAAEYCRRALDLEANNAEALALFAICLHELGEAEEEIHNCMLSAIELEPFRWEWVEFYANLLYEEGEREESFHYFDEIPVTEFRSPDSLKRLIKLLRKYRKDPEKIRECKQRASEVADGDSFESFLYSLQEGWERVDEENS